MSDQYLDQPLCEIQEFISFLEMCLGHTILEYKLKRLTKPGDNYGSLMQSVDVKVVAKSDPDETETLHLVTKSAVTNPCLVEIFQPSFTFVKETHFYTDIIPALEHFQQISNVAETERIDAFIQCLGSRISLNPNAKSADGDAVLLFENIKYLNYFNENRQVGFDRDTTLVILKTLAQIHALYIAMRRLQPELFNTKIYPYLQAVNMHSGDADDDTRFVDTICNELRFVDGLSAEQRCAIEAQFEACDKFNRNTARATDTPYTTIVHRDLWTNNIMIKRDDVTAKPTKVKIYDFQLYFYESFVCDLIFFLFTSVRCNDLTKHFTLFIKHYHSEFVKTMKSVNCELNDYTYEKMWNEIQSKAKIELLHSFFMVKIVAGDESSAPPSLDDVSSDTFYNGEKPSNAILDRWNCILNVCKENNFI